MALKTLNTLIKLHKRHVDVMRREMIMLEDERRALQELAIRLKDEHAQESQLAAEEPKVGSFFNNYSKQVKKKLETIAQSVKKLDAQIEAKIEAIRAEFSEQKKFEIAREQENKRIALDQLHKNQQRLDEVGSQQYQKAKGMPI
jgi:hypothetical protein